MHIISWKKISRPKNTGGLGIADIQLRNVALLSKWVWKWKWWEIPLTKDCIWESLKSFKSPSVKDAWGISISATLWTLWIARNQENFEGMKLNQKNLEYLIIFRSLSWCEAVNLLEENSLNVWVRNPIGAILRSSTHDQNFLNVFQVIGYVDGSWKEDHLGKTVACIGDFLIDSDGNQIFLFSGPVKVAAPIVSEFEALIFLLEKIKSSK
ncbi:hypothetical protein POM88_029920 [Heracleum sosnowskyi]|uniref:Uncharacterized protein n=1 Tax=Heracleum sosnowskyi TaxID=360622 RepID=A0AAD8MI70_9APIA|nr:hypothetical protein POM88_029920 [Heracleum sosnowskyi]